MIFRSPLFVEIVAESGTKCFYSSWLELKTFYFSKYLLHHWQKSNCYNSRNFLFDEFFVVLKWILYNRILLTTTALNKFQENQQMVRQLIKTVTTVTAQRLP